jgi:hypothetical protein
VARGFRNCISHDELFIVPHEEAWFANGRQESYAFNELQDTGASQRVRSRLAIIYSAI